jgi:hypothetical protein
MKMGRIGSGACIALIVIARAVSGQDIFPPDVVKKNITAGHTTADLRVDGQLDEEAWARATVVENFIQADPYQGAAPKRRTVVKLLYNQKYLYVAAVCYDTVGTNNYRVLNLQRDYRASQNDFFAVAIDGYNDERNCTMFMLNPYGAQRDLLSFDDNYYEPDWDGLWRGRTQRTDTAWIAEIAVPWKTLRYKENAGALQTWGISFARLARSLNEVSYYPAFPRAYGGLRMPYAAKLTGLPAPKPSLNLRVQPYIMFSDAITRQNDRQISSARRLKAGGEAKWAINPNALLDLTFNTDFAQADADRKVINTNRFSVFFPERRQFFLENSGVFSAGLEPLANDFSEFSTRIQPFFSRTVGLDGQGNPLHIVAGGRFVYRSEKKNLGGLVVRQEGNAATSPATFFVGRYSRNIGKQNRIGALVSLRSTDAGSPGNDLTYTLDGFMRYTQSLSLSYMLSGTSAAATANGLAGAFQLLYNSNAWSSWWNESVVDRHYNPATGFVARPNTIVSEMGATRQFRARWLPRNIRSFTPGISATACNNAATGVSTDQYLTVSPLSFRFQNGGGVSWSWIFFRQNLENEFTPLNTSIKSGIYSYSRHRLTFLTDPSRKLSFNTSINGGRYYDGYYHSLTANFVVAPIPNIYLSGVAEIGKTIDLGEKKDSHNVTLYTLESRLALNTRIQLTSLFQRSGVNNSLGWNIRLAWEYKPLSYVYLVFNSNTSSDTVRKNDKVFIAKISYLKQF